MCSISCLLLPCGPGDHDTSTLQPCLDARNAPQGESFRTGAPDPYLPVRFDGLLRTRSNAVEDPVPRLTPRERDVLDELCRPVITGDAFTEPASIRTIAAALFITEAAVKQHLLHLYDKFEIYEDGQRRRIRLANEALRRGVVSVGGDVPGSDVAATDLVAQGRRLLADHAWEHAFDVLTAADAAGGLDADGLAALGEAAVG